MQPDTDILEFELFIYYPNIGTLILGFHLDPAAQKEGQEHVLAIKIKRDGWQWAMDNSCLSHFDSSIHDSYEAWKTSVKNSPVRIQWDPERDIYLEKLDYRAIQVGLSGEAVPLYVNEWITEIFDITELSKSIKNLIDQDKIEEAKRLLPKEVVFP